MADKPIIFSAPMVRALLDGRKTQTRRVLKPQPKVLKNGIWYRPYPVLRPLQWQYLHGDRIAGFTDARYATGDRLWVREAVCWVSRWGWRYRADDDDLSDKREAGEVGRWRPSIHMPRLASRITMTVTDVRVQRLQEISEADAVAEGVPHIHEGNIGDEPYCSKCEGRGVHGAFGAGYGVTEVDCSECVTARQKFRNLWNSLHGPEAWDANPWVAAYTFTVQRGNIDSQEGM